MFTWIAHDFYLTLWTNISTRILVRVATAVSCKTYLACILGLLLGPIHWRCRCQWRSYLKPLKFSGLCFDIEFAIFYIKHLKWYKLCGEMKKLQCIRSEVCKIKLSVWYLAFCDPHEQHDHHSDGNGIHCGYGIFLDRIFRSRTKV